MRFQQFLHGSECVTRHVGKHELSRWRRQYRSREQCALERFNSVAALCHGRNNRDAKLVDEAKKPHGSTFRATLTHTEWLGNEQYGYINFDPSPEVRELLNNLARDMDADELRPQVVVTLDAASRIRGGRESEIWLDTRKLHLFDPETGENLTRDAEAGAALTAEANEERAEEIANARDADHAQEHAAGNGGGGSHRAAG